MAIPARFRGRIFASIVIDGSPENSSQVEQFELRKGATDNAIPRIDSIARSKWNEQSTEIVLNALVDYVTAFRNVDEQYVGLIPIFPLCWMLRMARLSCCHSIFFTNSGRVFCAKVLPNRFWIDRCKNLR